MQDLDRALADLVTIRAQLARQTTFRGFGAAALAITACLAFATSLAQSAWPNQLAAEPAVYFGVWIATAVVAATLIGVEALRRAHRLHAGLADAMVAQAIEGFLPAGGTGVCLGLVLAGCAPDQLWMLPGLWQILVGLGLFASVRILPQGAVLGAVWYLMAGFAVLVMTSTTHSLSPWSMGIPFAIGQGILAWVMYRHGSGQGGHDGDL
ncbi:hypothetical protein [Methylobacterium segetis]|uniref:hypothetical protein n=1 Tax=Methylobacterium segetis TaxID=2488750 RepID=UPI001044B33E|nr:hypothetical protein [Methylobacterium segetis]